MKNRLLSASLRLALLFLGLPACSSGDGSPDAAKPSSLSCFTVSADADAKSVGALDGPATHCNRTLLYQKQNFSDGTFSTTTTVHVIGEAGETSTHSSARTVGLTLTYANAEVAIASFAHSDACQSSRMGVRIQLGYSAQDPADGVFAEWDCKTCKDPDGTFELDLTSLEGAPPEHLDIVPTLTSNTVHGTLHAVCLPNASASGDSKPGLGSVTLDGPF